MQGQTSLLFINHTKIIYESTVSVHYLTVVWFERWVFSQLRISIFIVDIVADANELLTTVGAGYKNYSDSYSIALWNQPCVRSISLKEQIQSQK